MRSGQKGLDEIQRIRAAMESKTLSSRRPRGSSSRKMRLSWGKMGTPSSRTSRQRPKQKDDYQQTFSKS
jgi:hypothetical protein